MAEEQCFRCGDRTGRLYDHQVENDDGEKVFMKLCWSCDHDVINGGDYFVDRAELQIEREEQEYEEDPINNPRPSWWNNG